jgi:uncharacterized protein (TIGR00369 family)
MTVQPDADGYIAWVNSLPLAAVFGITCVRAARGSTTMTLSQSPIAANPNGAVHGGIVSALIDHAMGATAMTVMTARTAAVTATLNIDYLAPATLPLTFETTVIRHSRALVFVQTEVRSGQRLVDVATGTFVPLADYLMDPAEATSDLPAYYFAPPRLEN